MICYEWLDVGLPRAAFTTVDAIAAYCRECALVCARRREIVTEAVAAVYLPAVLGPLIVAYDLVASPVAVSEIAAVATTATDDDDGDDDDDGEFAPPPRLRKNSNFFFFFRLVRFDKASSRASDETR